MEGKQVMTKHAEPVVKAGEKFLLFVYGTLMSDGCRAHVLKGQTKLKDAQTSPNYQLLDLGSFPGLVRLENDGRSVHGEIWEVDGGLKPILDRIEGSPRMYGLEPVSIDGDDRQIYAYFFRLRSPNTAIYEAARWDNSR